MTTTDWVIIASVALLVLGTLFNRIRALEGTVAKHEEYLRRLTDYAKEIDVRFDEERRLLADLNDSVEKDGVSLAGINHMELVKEKRARGERTLLDPI
jgi:hypothetical protein